MSRLLPALAAVVLICSSASAQVTIRLASNGKAIEPIIISETASAETRDVAVDLATQLQRITGATFDIQVGDGTHGIALGLAADFPALDLQKKLDAPDPECRELYLLKSHARGLYVIGAQQLGLQNAANDLLHRLGYRQFFPGEAWEVVPSVPDANIAVDTLESPDYFYRRIWYGFGGWPDTSDLTKNWQKRNRMVSGYQWSSGHAYESIIRYSKETLEAHPEYLGLLGGERKSSKLCISNPGARDMALQFALKRFETRPETDCISMEPSDGGNWCECEPCAALGSISDRVVTLANHVAAGLEAAGHHTLVSFYAYSTHQEAPSIKVHPNISIGVATAFRKAGTTLEQTIANWAAAGAKTFGIREFYSVFVWDRNVPGGPRPARISYVTTTIPQWRDAGIRYFSSESTNGWGPAGLGYYIAGRGLWDVNDIRDPQPLIDDFLDKAFGHAREPMRAFYQLIDSDNNPWLSSHLLHRMYELLGEASRINTDPAIQARLDDLILYTRYVELYRQFDIVEKVDVQAAYEAMVRHGYRIRRTCMVDSYPLYRNFYLRFGRGATVPDEAKFNVPEPGNPWKDSTPYPRGEIDAFVANGLANQHASEIEMRTFTRDLVPATDLNPPSDAEMGQLPRARAILHYHTWIDHPGETLTFDIASGLLNHKTQPADTPVQLFSVAEDESQTEQSAGAVVADKQPHAVSLTSNETGLHMLTINAGGTSARPEWKPGLPVTVEMSREEAIRLSGYFTAYFFVPRGTKRVCLFADPALLHKVESTTIHDGSDAVRHRFEELKSGYIVMDVPEGQDGTFWKVRNYAGRLALLNVPPYIARHPTELLVPREVK